MPKKKTKKQQRWKDRPLKAFVSRGVLTIEIGIDTLAFAALRSDYAFSLIRDEPINDPREYFRIDDRQEFARDVLFELQRELGEDGSSLLTNLFDKATENAIEQGSIAFVDAKDPD